MGSGLEAVFSELGLLQYIEAFVEQGFDEWDIILDIQESDLDALGVKLGHRRKLQRRIANARGISPRASLVSPVKPAPEDQKVDGARPDHSRPEGIPESHGVQKRKYRRHPKPDPNAPERPPSAYVLFSNKMREDLKSQNLSFTEIAKLVGENWQSLRADEKEVYDKQANVDKDKYHRDLVEYKKTREYKEYALYLQEFKQKQAKQSQANDPAKRAKLEPARLRHGSSSSTATPGENTSSGSSSERVQESEPPPSRNERLNSVASIAESQHSSAALSQHNSADDSTSSPRTTVFDGGSPRDSHYPNGNRQHNGVVWRENARVNEAGHKNLPSLSDVLDDGRRSMPAPSNSEGSPYFTGFVAANHPRSVPEAPNVLPGPPRPPHLRQEYSSSSSHGSTSPVNGFARTLGEGTLPIHALLSHQVAPGPVSAASVAFDRGSPPSVVGGATPSPTDPLRPPFGPYSGPRGYGFPTTLGTSQLMREAQLGDGDVLMATPPDAPMFAEYGGPAKARLDGVSALLRAGEIVEKHDRDDFKPVLVLGKDT